MQPDAVTAADVDRATAAAAAKHGPLAPLRLERLHEGEVMQVLHVGPYATEPATIATLHRAIAAAGLEAVGAHHEIYLSDPRRTAPAKLRTILRQPVTRR